MKNIYKIIDEMKNHAGLALATAIEPNDLTNCSEEMLAVRWLQQINQHPELYESGWYVPPPQGIIAVFGKDLNNFDRITQPSFRPQFMWPQPHSLYNKGDIIAVYASPVHRQTNMIGDFGMNIYEGENTKIHDHFEKVLEATIAIANFTNIGMPFCEIYQQAMQLAQKYGFENNIESFNDRAGTNVGHTIPLSYASDPTHAQIASATSFEDIKNTISRGRKFINREETQCVEPNMAFTIEPRFSTSDMPNTWFHLTVIYENGTRKICHGFKPVFEKFNMYRLLSLLPS
jgi:hypothetical protein